MDEETLNFLLAGGRISMEDRIAKGLWPHPPLSMRMLAAHIARRVRRDGYVPRPWQDHVQGESVLEGGVLEQRGRFHYVYRAQRAHPADPRTLAEVGEQRFFSAVSAAMHYLKWDLHLPGSLDGWKVQ